MRVELTEDRAIVELQEEDHVRPSDDIVELEQPYTAVAYAEWDGIFHSRKVWDWDITAFGINVPFQGFVSLISQPGEGTFTVAIQQSKVYKG